MSVKGLGCSRLLTSKISRQDLNEFVVCHFEISVVALQSFCYKLLSIELGFFLNIGKA
jgi:hypothetical protein